MLVFDVIWLAIPLFAFVVSIRRPEAARAAIGRVSAWMVSHQNAILIFIFSGAGIYFTAKGLVDLLA